MCCAGGRAVLQAIDEDGTQQNSAKVGVLWVLPLLCPLCCVVKLTRALGSCAAWLKGVLRMAACSMQPSAAVGGCQGHHVSLLIIREPCQHHDVLHKVQNYQLLHLCARTYSSQAGDTCVPCRQVHKQHRDIRLKLNPGVAAPGSML